MRAEPSTTVSEVLRDLIDLCDDDDPARALVGLRELRAYAEQREAEVVAAARAAGWSWQAIARVLGVPKQTLYSRYGGTRP